MPTRTDQRALSKRIREREGQRCKRCKAPNGKFVARGEGIHAGTYMVENGEVFDDETGESRGRGRGSEYLPRRLARVDLAVVHLDHDPTNNADDNLAALCRRCGFAHSQEQHAANARATRRSRKAAGNLPGIG